MLKAATDTELEVANSQLKTTKQRDCEHSHPLAFELIIHSLGTNAYGEDVTSCVLEELEAPAQSDFDDLKLTDKQRAGKDVLEDLVIALTQNPVELAAWAHQLKATAPFQKLSSEESLSRATRRVQTQLADKGVLSYDKEKQLLTYIADTGADDADS